jgi:hypothetical protein
MSVRGVVEKMRKEGVVEKDQFLREMMRKAIG